MLGEPGGKGALRHCWWGCQLLQLLWKQRGVPLKLNIEIPCGPAVPVRGTCTKETELAYYGDTCTPVGHGSTQVTQAPVHRSMEKGNVVPVRGWSTIQL